MKLADPSHYTSSWQWTKDHSRYHFDWTRRDQPGEWFTPLGRFQGDWSAELAEAEKNTETITWATRKYSPYFTEPDGTKHQSSMLRQEEHDLENIGASTDQPLTDIKEIHQLGPVLTRMSEYFGIKDPWVRLHIQKPGQMFHLHIDKLWDWCPDDPEQVVRMVVNLTDWEPGHFYSYGTCVLTHWRAGDVHLFDWPNVPHATANAGLTSRPTMIMTGVKTSRTRDLLSAATADSVYVI